MDNSFIAHEYLQVRVYQGENIKKYIVSKFLLIYLKIYTFIRFRQINKINHRDNNNVT